MFCALEGILFLPGNFPGYTHAPSPFCSQSSEEQWERKLPLGSLWQLAYLHSARGALAVRMGNLLSLAARSALQSKCKEFGSNVSFNYLEKEKLIKVTNLGQN